MTLEAAATLSDSDLVEMILGRDADFVVVAVGGGNPQAEQVVLSALRRTGLSIGLLPALRGLPVIGFRQHYFLGHDIVMLVRRNNLARPSSRLLKAVFDQVGAIMLLSLLAPLMLVLALLIRADGGPALYRHRRIGAGGRVFDCIKFRSMVVNADKVLRQVIANDPACRSRMVCEPEAARRSTGDQAWLVSAPFEPRRVAADLQCAARRDEPGRSPTHRAVRSGTLRQ